MVKLAPAHDVQGPGFSIEFPCGLISNRECDSWRDWYGSGQALAMTG